MEQQYFKDIKGLRLFTKLVCLLGILPIMSKRSQVVYQRIFVYVLSIVLMGTGYLGIQTKIWFFIGHTSTMHMVLFSLVAFLLTITNILLTLTLGLFKVKSYFALLKQIYRLDDIFHTWKKFCCTSSRHKEIKMTISLVLLHLYFIGRIYISSKFLNDHLEFCTIIIMEIFFEHRVAISRCISTFC